MQSTSPLISVIINNYNHGKYLPAAINSVLQQDFTDYELIVVDDASTDHSHDVMAYFGNQIKPVILPVNNGQGAAFNAGFAASRGELIVFLDADDLFIQGKLSTVASVYQANPNVTMIHHQGQRITQNLDPFGVIFPRHGWNGLVRKKILRYSEALFPSTSFLSFPRSFLQLVMPLTPYLTRHGADFPLQVLAGIMGEVAFINQSLTFYRRHSSNHLSSSDFSILETFHRFLRQTEADYTYINKKLASLGLKYRLNVMQHRVHRRSLFIFKHIGWWKYLSYALTNPNFETWRDRWQYTRFGIYLRNKYNQESIKKSAHEKKYAV